MVIQMRQLDGGFTKHISIPELDEENRRSLGLQTCRLNNSRVWPLRLYQFLERTSNLRFCLGLS
jgi:hypothetical protein